MSFAAGFVDQMNKIQDRNLKKELLSQEMRGRRENELASLIAKRRARTSAATNETAALNALRARLGDAEGADDYMTTVANAGVASQIMGGINQEEANAPERELRISGESLMKNFTVYPGEDGPTVRIPTQEQIRGASAEDLQRMKIDLLSASEPGSKAYVDVNAQGLASGSTKQREAATEQFDSMLIQQFSSTITDSTDPENVGRIKALNDLESDSVVKRERARAKLMRTPEAISIYNQMMDLSAEVPTFGALKNIPGSFTNLGRANLAVQNWDLLEPDVKAQMLQFYPYIEPLVRN